MFSMHSLAAGLHNLMTDTEKELLSKYNKLKKRYRLLEQEYSKVLENWETATKNVETLSHERKFYKQKLDVFFKSQHFVDDIIFNKPDLKAAQLKKPNNIQPSNIVPPS